MLFGKSRCIFVSTTNQTNANSQNTTIMQTQQSQQLELQYRELAKKSINLTNSSNQGKEIEALFLKVQKQMREYGYTQEQLDLICCEVHAKNGVWY